MNRYQLEVAEFDRRRRRTVRCLSILGTAMLMMVALWSSGFPPSGLWTSARKWIAAPETSQRSAVARNVPDSESTVEPATGAGSATSAAAGTDSSISATPQRLLLVATSPGRNSREGTANLGTDPDNPQTYTAGALLANGAQLSEIYVDHVVLTRGDSSARLWLYRRAGNAAELSANSALLSVGGEPVLPPPPVIASREVLTDYLRPSPLYDGVVLRGYQVYPGRKSGVFAQLGLQAGDVITSINDVPFADPLQAMEMLNQLADGVAVTATVLRKSTLHRITLDGAVISADLESSRASANAAEPWDRLPPT